MRKALNVRRMARGVDALGLTGFTPTRALTASKTQKVVVAGPQTGPLAFFCKPAPFAFDGTGKAFGGTYAAHIAAFKQAGEEIAAGALTPHDFTSFWLGAVQQGFAPKCVTLGKALEFPRTVEALGDRAVGLSLGCWRDPSRPFASDLAGQAARQLADANEAASGRQRTVTLGDRHAIVEVLADVLTGAESSKSEAIRDAITATKYRSIVGPIDLVDDRFRIRARRPCRNRPRVQARPPIRAGALSWWRSAPPLSPGSLHLGNACRDFSAGQSRRRWVNVDVAVFDTQNNPSWNERLRLWLASAPRHLGKRHRAKPT